MRLERHSRHEPSKEGPDQRAFPRSRPMMRQADNDMILLAD